MGPFQGSLNGTDAADTAKVRITLDADRADVLVGGKGRGGDIELRDDAGVAKIRLDAGGLEKPENIVKPLPSETILLSGDTGTIEVGGHGQNGSLILRKPYLNDPSVAIITLRAETGDLSIGGLGADGDIKLLDKAGVERMHLGAGGGNIWLGGNGENGDIMVFPSSATDISQTNQATIRLDGGEHTIRLKSPNNENVLKDRILINAEGGDIWLGGNGANGALVLFDDKGDNSTLSKATIWLRGSDGDIILQNGDCAEDFDISESAEVEPGTVMVLDPEGKLRQSTEAYDRKVAGVIAGAGDHKPGIVLDKKPSQDNRLPIALMGKVYCKVDARYSAIEVGDLLTTSPTAGHAMKAGDPARAFGAVIGKALRPLQAQTGLIPILIALQ